MTERYFKVIMPVASDEDAPQKQHLIQQVALKHELVARIPKYNLTEPTFDIHSEVEDLKGSLFVIADLSLERPSCYYELGIAEALGKKVYLIAHTGTAIHQTANRKALRFYQDMNQLKSVIEEVIRQAI
jgi:hypothetical protein